MRIGVRMRKLLLAAMIALSVAGQEAMAVWTIDLTGGTGSSGSANGAYFEWVDQGSTGTGVIDSFLRIQANGTERGYNTDGTEEFDTKDSRAIQLSAIPLVEKNGKFYREFLLDIHEAQSANGRFLSLDKVEIYLADTGTLTGYPALGTKVFDLDGAGDATILLDATLNPGSGRGDAFMYVPITGDVSKYVYLYSEFGETYTSDATFEEWAVFLPDVVPPPPPPPPPSVPAPGALLLVLGGSGLAVSLNRRKQL